MLKQKTRSLVAVDKDVIKSVLNDRVRGLTNEPFTALSSKSSQPAVVISDPKKIIKKVSKVQILTTQRIQKSDCIIEEEKRIPLHHFAFVNHPKTVQSSQFASKVERPHNLLQSSIESFKQENAASADESPRLAKVASKRVPFNTSSTRDLLMPLQKSASRNNFPLLKSWENRQPSRSMALTKRIKPEFKEHLTSEKSESKPIIQVIADARKTTESPGPGTYALDI